MSEQKKEEKKKEKVVYYDDGRTLADMSGVGRPRSQGSKSTFREKWITYWSAVKMMLIPMAIVVGILVIMYLIMYFSLK